MDDEWLDEDLRQDISEGRWVADSVTFAPTTTVGSLVPAGFDAYARILYPVRLSNPDGDSRLVRWSDIARHTGTIAHAEMELHALTAKTGPGFLRSDPPTPAAQVLDWREQLEGVVQVLAQHTSTPDDCWFAFWEGNTSLDDIRTTAPTVTIGGFDYFLLRGHGARATQPFRALAPHIWWPADHSWCMVAHFDFPCVYLGGSHQAVGDVLAMPEIEAWPARVDQIVTADNDHLNR
ncbi:hypothetical protein O1W68_13655 [Rhodococcus sp. H36-A4]|uniref:hypothetical protein n=1 Tax=Rhodococcus sp. H36-A4 TaxID=3004353 RepID=UPI0022AF0E02|nr:hypothetical protein [Rhodococcus sp. H36-A4]MCZ4078994.1 hypothetical protein [Rhodococcus sp. H36-A4]